MNVFDSKLTISPEIFEKCINFSLASAPTNMYAINRRGQTHPEYIKKQIKNGKIAEVLVHSELSKIYPGLSSPDFNIYDNKSKSWDSDLKDATSNIKVAVKSQEMEQALQYYESWVFQFNDGKRFDCDKDIFNKDIDPHYYVAFVLLNTPKKIGQIKAVVSVQWLRKNNLFQQMTLQKFNVTHNKLAVYYDHPKLNSLIRYKDELWQL